MSNETKEKIFHIVYTVGVSAIVLTIAVLVVRAIFFGG